MGIHMTEQFSRDVQHFHSVTGIMKLWQYTITKNCCNQIFTSALPELRLIQQRQIQLASSTAVKGPETDTK